jgi:hypothetical protein
MSENEIKSVTNKFCKNSFANTDNKINNASAQQLISNTVLIKEYFLKYEEPNKNTD